jgi:hypothetical protein
MLQCISWMTGVRARTGTLGRRRHAAAAIACAHERQAAVVPARLPPQWRVGCSYMHVLLRAQSRAAGPSPRGRVGGELWARLARDHREDNLAVAELLEHAVAAAVGKTASSPG